jgi:hypothetical protein
MPTQEHCLCKDWLVLTFPQGLYDIFLLYFYEPVHCFHIFPNCSIGVPTVNGSVPVQQAFSMPFGNPGVIPASVLPTQVMPTPVAEPVGIPSECLLLKNMFDPSTEVCDELIIYFSP